MAVDTTFHDPFGDPFDTQQSVTPPIGGMKTKGNTKLLVVIFIIDCSMTMYCKLHNFAGLKSLAAPPLYYQSNP